MALEDWQKQLQSAEKEREKFIHRGRIATRAYKGESSDDNRSYDYNLFWANTGVLRSAIYANPPKPVVAREFGDYQDDVARVAAIMMERLLKQDMAEPIDPVHTAMAAAVNDRLVPGMGQVWIRYEPTIEEITVGEAVAADGTIIAEAQTVEQLVDEKVEVDYVYWEDFFWSPARTWDEVWWVARRVYMTPAEVLENFGEEAARQVNYQQKYDKQTSGQLTPNNLQRKKAEIFEVWNKKNRTMCFYTRDSDKALKDVANPPHYPDFWPCPRPLAANIVNGNFMPKSDFEMVKSQYSRIDMLSRRIFMLEEAIRVAGVYDKSNAELQDLLQRGGNNVMVGVDNWALFAERGGMRGSVDWFPLDQVVNAVMQLRSELEAANQQLYELIGISDIMRGTTAPRETLGAQKLKAQYSSARLQYLQMEVAAFVLNVLKLKASVIVRDFQPETIVKRSNIMLTPDAQYAADAVFLLKDEWEAVYRIKIDVDQMAIPDYNAEQSSRIEFINAMGQFISMVWPLIQAEPGSAPFLLQVLQWGASSFHQAAGIEGVFDDAAKALLRSQAQKQQQPPRPDPKMVEVQAKIKRENAESAAEIRRNDMKTQADIAQDWKETEAQIRQMAARTRGELASKAIKQAEDDT